MYYLVLNQRNSEKLIELGLGLAISTLSLATSGATYQRASTVALNSTQVLRLVVISKFLVIQGVMILSRYLRMTLVDEWKGGYVRYVVTVSMHHGSI